MFSLVVSRIRDIANYPNKGRTLTWSVATVVNVTEQANTRGTIVTDAMGQDG